VALGRSAQALVIGGLALSLSLLPAAGAAQKPEDGADEIPTPFAPKKPPKGAAGKGRPKPAPPPKEEEEEPPPEEPESKDEGDQEIKGRHDTAVKVDAPPPERIVQVRDTGPEVRSIGNADPALNEVEVEPPIDERSLKERLESRAKIVRAGDLKNADSDLTSLVELKQTLGIRNLPMISTSLIMESKAAIERGEIDRANLDALIAGLLSPEMVEAHRMRLRAALSYRLAGIVPTVRALKDLLIVQVKGFRNQVDLASRVVAVFGLSFLTMILIFAVLQLLKQLRYAGHDLVHLLPVGELVSEPQGMLTTLLAVVAPFALGFGVVLSLALALAISALYQKRHERIVSWILLLWLATLPASIQVVSPLITFWGSPAERLAALATETTFGGESEQLLVDLAQKNGEFAAAFTLGMRSRIRGDFPAAERWYKKALLIQPGNIAAENNLADILTLTRRLDQAIPLYKSAGQSKTRSEPWLNLATVQNDKSQFEDAKASIEVARQINPELAHRYQELDNGTPTFKRLVDVQLEEVLLWSRFFVDAMSMENGERSAVAAQLWRPLGGKTPQFVMPALVLALMIGAMMLHKRRTRFGLSIACPKCGMPASPEVNDAYCRQCQAIYRSGASEPKLRAEKEYRIRLHQALELWTERLLGLVAGAGDVYGGRPLVGSILLLFFLGAVFHIVWASEVPIHAWSLGADVSLGSIAAGFIALTLVLVSLRRVFKHR
jgi:tetratricopeptide (TPR) repeat protein